MYELLDCYDQVDSDHGEMVTRGEFFRWLGVPETPMAVAFFSLSDKDGSGEISFNEFICITCLYSMYTFDDINKFAFSVFDKDDRSVEAAGAVEDAPTPSHPTPPSPPLP